MAPLLQWSLRGLLLHTSTRESQTRYTLCHVQALIGLAEQATEKASTQQRTLEKLNRELQKQLDCVKVSFLGSGGACRIQAAYCQIASWQQLNWQCHLQSQSKLSIA
jgi:predicted nucleic acid-binding protein